MKNLTFLLVAAIALSGCATIFTQSSYPVTFNSTPSGVDVTVVNRAGNTVYTGTTPASVTLKAAAGYMKREEYSVTFAGTGLKTTTVPVVCSLDGWYIGNILIGGLIGMLIVDPASGAMYKFANDNINVNLSTAVGQAANGRELKIIDIGEVPKDTELTRIN